MAACTLLHTPVCSFVHTHNELTAPCAPLSPRCQVRAAYSAMQREGQPPDSYTFTALLSALSRASAPLADVEGIASEMRAARVPLNTQLGTALINAYKRTPEVTGLERDSVEMILERADGVLAQLVAERTASVQTYALTAAMHAQVCVASVRARSFAVAVVGPWTT